ncbi:MAG: hypothetical protein QXH81_08145 [Thermofilaceae archaeon]
MEKVKRGRIDVERVLAAVRSDKPDLMDWILAFLYACGGSVPSRAHLRCALYIASKHLPSLAEVADFEEG